MAVDRLISTESTYNSSAYNFLDDGNLTVLSLAVNFVSIDDFKNSVKKNQSTLSDLSSLLKYLGIDRGQDIKLRSFRDRRNQSSVFDTISISESTDVQYQTYKLNIDDLILLPEEIIILQEYSYIASLLIQCKKAASRISPDIWRNIEDKLLLP